MSLGHGASIVRSGSVLQLDAANPKSYPGSGTTWTDLSGKSNHGTLTNGPTFNNGNGGSIAFDGTNDLVNLGSTNNLTGNNLQTLTVNIWLKYSSTTMDLRAFTLSRASGGTNSSLLGINCNANISAGTTTLNLGALGFFTRNFDNSAHTGLVFNDNYHLKNRFINLHCVIDGMNRYLYIDGILKNSDNNIGIQSVSNNTDPAYIGTGPAGAGSVPWTGLISNVVFYNRALTEPEIQRNFNALRGRYNI